MSDEDKLTTLVELDLGGILNNSHRGLFEWGYLTWDWKWYDVLQDHFDDLNDSIESAKSIANEIRKKYNLN